MITDLLGCLVETRDGRKGRIRAVTTSSCGQVLRLWIEVNGVLEDMPALGTKILEGKP